jgi:hypothetical protein
MTTTGEDADAAGDEPATDARRPPITLESSLVRYDGDPDRRTIYPPGLSSVARMSTWLSADSDAFVDLEDAR